MEARGGGICPNLRRVEEKGKLFEIPFGDRIGGGGARSLRERRRTRHQEKMAGLGSLSLHKKGAQEKNRPAALPRPDSKGKDGKFEAGGEGNIFFA